MIRQHFLNAFEYALKGDGALILFLIKELHDDSFFNLLLIVVENSLSAAHKLKEQNMISQWILLQRREVNISTDLQYPRTISFLHGKETEFYIKTCQVIEKLMPLTNLKL